MLFSFIITNVTNFRSRFVHSGNDFINLLMTVERIKNLVEIVFYKLYNEFDCII